MSATPVPSVAIQPVTTLSESIELIRDRYWLFLGITLVGWFIASVVPLGILAGPMMCGIYMCYFRLMRGEPVVFDHLFKGFDHFAQSLVATLVIVGAMLVVMVPAYVAMFAATLASASAASASDDGGAVAGVLLMLFMLVFVVAVVAVSLFAGMISIFAYPLIVDRGLGGIDALKTAMRTVVANFWGLLGLVLLVGLIATVASMLCIIPYFFVIPWIFGAFAITYRRLFPDTSAAA